MLGIALRLYRAIKLLSPYVVLWKASLLLGALLCLSGHAHVTVYGCDRRCVSTFPSKLFFCMAVMRLWLIAALLQRSLSVMLLFFLLLSAVEEVHKEQHSGKSTSYGPQPTHKFLERAVLRDSTSSHNQVCSEPVRCR